AALNDLHLSRNGLRPAIPLVDVRGSVERKLEMKGKLGKAQRGFSTVEMLVVVFVMLITAAIASPNIMQAVYNVRLRTTAGDLAGLMQQARILAAKGNTPYDIRYTTLNGVQIAFIDLNLDGTYASGEPLVQFSGTVVPAAGAPTGTGGQPSPYVLIGDS